MTIPQILKVVGKQGYYYISEKSPEKEFKEEEKNNESLRQLIFTTILHQKHSGLEDEDCFVNIDVVIDEINELFKAKGSNIRINFSSLYYLVTTSKNISFKFDEVLERIKL